MTEETYAEKQKAAQRKLLDVLSSTGSVFDTTPAGLMNMAAEMLSQLFAQQQLASEQGFGLPIEQESKYTTDGFSIINRASGKSIPHDEPIGIIRAQDPYFVATWAYYAAHINDPAHQVAIGRLIDRGMAWQSLHPDRVKKEPDTAI